MGIILTEKISNTRKHTAFGTRDSLRAQANKRLFEWQTLYEPKQKGSNLSDNLLTQDNRQYFDQTVFPSPSKEA